MGEREGGKGVGGDGSSVWMKGVLTGGVGWMWRVGERGRKQHCR